MIYTLAVMAQSDKSMTSIDQFVNKYVELAHTYVKNRFGDAVLEEYPIVPDNKTRKYDIVDRAVREGFVPIDIGMKIRNGKLPPRTDISRSYF